MDSNHFSISYFGKLPEFSDFVRYNASSKYISVFDQWVEQAIYTAQSKSNTAWDSAFENAPACCFHFPLNANQLLIGIWHPSHDKVGRKYPFVIAMQVDGRMGYTYKTQLLPVLFNLFLNEADQQINNAMNNSDLQQLADNIENLKAKHSNEMPLLVTQYEEYLINTTMGRFWSSLWENSVDSRKNLIMANLLEILLPLHRHNASQISLGLKFPLGKNYPTLHFNISFWLEVSLRLLKNSTTSLYYFWPLPGKDISPRLFLFFSLPLAKSFLSLIKNDYLDDNICELDEEGSDRNDKMTEVLQPHYRSLLDNSKLTLNEFLTRL